MKHIKLFEQFITEAATSPVEIKKNFEDYVEGYYVAKDGPAFNNPAQLNPSTAKWVAYSSNPEDLKKYEKSGYVHIFINSRGDLDVRSY